MINKQVNSDLKLYGSQMAMSFDEDIIADYGMIGNSPSVSDKILHFDVNGTFFNVKNKTTVPFEPMEFPESLTKDKELWAVVSSYTLYTLLDSGLEMIFDADKKDQAAQFAVVVEEVLAKFANETD